VASSPVLGVEAARTRVQWPMDFIKNVEQGAMAITDS
jgi:hypothetical protein